MDRVDELREGMRRGREGGEGMCLFHSSSLPLVGATGWVDSVWARFRFSLKKNGNKTRASVYVCVCHPALAMMNLSHLPGVDTHLSKQTLARLDTTSLNIALRFSSCAYRAVGVKRVYRDVCKRRGSISSASE